MKNPAQIILEKAILPTHLSSREIRERIAAEIRRKSIFSARTFEEGYLARMRDVASQVAGGTMDDATARMHLQDWLDATGYAPDKPGSLTDLGSTRRLQLILDTQRTQAANVALIRGEDADALEEFPAWELVSIGRRRIPRGDWPLRWAAAGEACGWEGAAQSPMAARKDSPIWQELGDGAGGFEDTLGNPYPPFAFGSSYNWMPLDRGEAEALGIEGTPRAAHGAAATLDPGERDIAETLKRFGPEFTAGLLKELRDAVRSPKS